MFLAELSSAVGTKIDRHRKHSSVSACIAYDHIVREIDLKCAAPPRSSDDVAHASARDAAIIEFVQPRRTLANWLAIFAHVVLLLLIVNDQHLLNRAADIQKRRPIQFTSRAQYLLCVFASADPLEHLCQFRLGHLACTCLRAAQVPRVPLRDAVIADRVRDLGGIIFPVAT